MSWSIGKVKKYIHKKQFGFITSCEEEDENEFFVHKVNIIAKEPVGPDTRLYTGEYVYYRVLENNEESDKKMLPKVEVSGLLGKTLRCEDIYLQQQHRKKNQENFPEQEEI